MFRVQKNGLKNEGPSHPLPPNSQNDLFGGPSLRMSPNFSTSPKTISTHWTHWLQWGSFLAAGIITAKIAPHFLSAVRMRFAPGILDRAIKFWGQEFLVGFGRRPNHYFLAHLPSTERLDTLCSMGGPKIGVHYFFGRPETLILEELDGPIVLRIRGLTTNTVFETTFALETDAYRFLVDNRHLWMGRPPGADHASLLPMITSMNTALMNVVKRLNRAEWPPPPLRGFAGNSVIFAHPYYKPGGQSALMVYETSLGGTVVGSAYEAVAAYVSRPDPRWQKLTLKMIDDAKSGGIVASILVHSNCRAGKLLERFRYERRLHPTDLPEVEIIQGQELLAVLRAQKLKGVQEVTSARAETFFQELERRIRTQLNAVAAERGMAKKTTVEVIRELNFKRGGFDLHGLRI